MIAFALALLLSQVTPALSSRVQHDATGEGFLVGWGYAQVPAVLCAQSPTNYVQTPENLAGLGWQVAGFGAAAAPTVTANFATAPDGTTHATRIQVASCANASDQSVVRQAVSSAPNGTAYGAFYIKGNGTSGTVSVAEFGLGPGVGTASVCTFNATDFTRCRVSQSTTGGLGAYLIVGCVNNAIYSGASNTGAVDVLVWGASLNSTPSGTFTAANGVCLP